MFGGRNAGDFDATTPPNWFVARQLLARIFFVDTEPWCADCTILIESDDELSIALARSCPDLRLFSTDERLLIFRNIYRDVKNPTIPALEF